MRFNSEGTVEDSYVLDMEPGKTYLLRLINAVLYSEYYLKIAGHKFTVVASDANYVNPFTTDVVAIAPGETLDVLVIADAAPGKYYMVALATQPPEPDHQIPVAITRAMVRYRSRSDDDGGDEDDDEEESPIILPDDDYFVVPVLPDMPDQHDNDTTFYFHGNLTRLRRRRWTRPAVPVRADEHMFITLSLGSVCRRGESCERSGSNESIVVATMNDVSFQLPTAVAASLLEAHYYHGNDTAAAAGVQLRTLPDMPLKVFNFTDRALIPWGPDEAWLEPTERVTAVRRFRHGAVVDVVFQSTSVMQSGSNPMHLHGHDVFVLAQGIGDYDAARDVVRYNLVDPPLKNTVVVPRLGWVAIRFVADNPGGLGTQVYSDVQVYRSMSHQDH
jgi:laccase